MQQDFDAYKDEVERGLTEDAVTSRIRPASSFGEDHTSFLWSPYLPIGDYALFISDGGTGKTMLACGIAAAVSAGLPLPGQDGFQERRNVLYVSAEDSGEQLKRRLVGADLDRVFLVDRTDSIGLSLSDDFDEFETLVRACSPALLVIDPWHAIVGASVDINRVNQLRPILQRLAGLSRNVGCATILISHANKRAQGENTNHAAVGSVDLVNASRSALRIVFDDEDKADRLMVHTKSNYAGYGRTVRFRVNNGVCEWNGFSDVDRKTLEAAARRRCTPGELAQGGHVPINQALVNALKADAGRMGATRFSYDEYKAMHGELIFGGAQPKRALDSVRPVLDAAGVYLRPCRVKKGGQAVNGFMIQQMDVAEPEQQTMRETVMGRFHQLHQPCAPSV